MNGGRSLQVTDALLGFGQRLDHVDVCRLQVFYLTLQRVDVGAVIGRRRRQRCGVGMLLTSFCNCSNGLIASLNLLL